MGLHGNEGGLIVESKKFFLTCKMLQLCLCQRIVLQFQKVYDLKVFFYREIVEGKMEIPDVTIISCRKVIRKGFWFADATMCSLP